MMANALPVVVPVVLAVGWPDAGGSAVCCSVVEHRRVPVDGTRRQYGGGRGESQLPAITYGSRGPTPATRRPHWARRKNLPTRGRRPKLGA